MKFDFIGNAKVKEQIAYLAESERLPHAIVIEGDEGLGKRTFAKEIALALFCRSDGEKPCHECAQCHKAMKGYHPDLYEYSATGGARSFHVDVVREVKEDVFISPNEAQYKIYILGNCQCMSESAQNAILKILEEPPTYAVFILTVNNKSALLETVLSRSVVLSLEGVDAPQGAEYICEKMPDVDYPDALNAVEVWGGNIGKAMQSLGDGKLSKISGIACDMADALIQPNEYELLKVCAVFERDRETLIAALSLLKSILRDALVYRNETVLLSGQKEQARALNSSLGKAKLMRLITTCDELIKYAEKNGNNAILITKVCYELRRAQNR
ncbi:MAG: DNA polymerase III subunit [Eubacterium sp.]|nr:DNA polymerase III subunit [Eubacterium sp.]